MFRNLSLIGRLIYIVTGFTLAFIVVSWVLLPSGNFTVLDVWRFFISPAIISLIAATIGARAGASSNVKATEEDLARTYWSLLDLVAQDIRTNLRIMNTVRDRFRDIERHGRSPVFYELSPESVHTMFFQDIEYPKLRKVVPEGSTQDIFHVRNAKYIFDHWNMLVDKYYRYDKPLIHDEGQSEMIERVTTDNVGRNFIASCEEALRAIERIQARIPKPKETTG